VTYFRLQFSQFSKAFAFACLILLAQCSSDTKDEYKEGTAEDLYNRAMDTLTIEQSYKKAAKQFEEVERQHPHSIWAVRSELMAAYSYFEGSAYEDSIQTLNAFIQLHPSHKDIAYAYYLLGMCYYVQLSGVNRDQHMTYNAQETFLTILKRFPTSIYAKDAKLKIDLLHEHLAGQDMEIGRLYQKKLLHVAALKRFQNVLKTYGTTSHVPEALHRMVEEYISLGMLKQAQATGAVLGHNFPGSTWYQDTYSLLSSKGLLSSDKKETSPEPKGAAGDSASAIHS
jgi:outer membrane protein assembly factor BamD